MHRRRAGGASGPASVPVGYAIGLAGLATFALGGVFDMIWHLTICTASVAFFLMVFSPFTTGAMTDGPYRFAALFVDDPDLGGWLVEEVQPEGVSQCHGDPG